MHGLIFETSVCYWQNQPGCYLYHADTIFSSCKRYKNNIQLFFIAIEITLYCEQYNLISGVFYFNVAEEDDIQSSDCISMKKYSLQ